MTAEQRAAEQCMLAILHEEAERRRAQDEALAIAESEAQRRRAEMRLVTDVPS